MLLVQQVLTGINLQQVIKRAYVSVNSLRSEKWIVDKLLDNSVSTLQGSRLSDSQVLENIFNVVTFIKQEGSEF